MGVGAHLCHKPPYSTPLDGTSRLLSASRVPRAERGNCRVGALALGRAWMPGAHLSRAEKGHRPPEAGGGGGKASGGGCGITFLPAPAGCASLGPSREGLFAAGCALSSNFGWPVEATFMPHGLSEQSEEVKRHPPAPAFSSTTLSRFLANTLIAPPRGRLAGLSSSRGRRDTGCTGPPWSSVCPSRECEWRAEERRGGEAAVRASDCLVIGLSIADAASG